MHAQLVALLNRGVPRFTDTTARDVALPSPVDNMVCATGSGTSSILWQRINGQWVQVLTTPGAWTAYTPTLGGTGTLGNGTLTGYYEKIGRTVRARALLTIGSTTVLSGNLSLSLPFAQSSNLGAAAVMPIGTAHAVDASVGSASRTGGTALFASSGAAAIVFDRSATGANSWSSSFPWLWATGDTLGIAVEYEAAS
jgi:hypothetical protein